MVPYLNLIYIGIWVAERYVYLSSFCFVALAVAAAERIFDFGQARGRALVLGLSLISLALNIGNKAVYLREWRTAETLWQYHLSLKEPSLTAYENLAAYYYAVFADAPPAEGAASLRKMSVVIDGALKQFWPDRTQPPPNRTAHIFFLKSLVEQVTGRFNAAVDSLKMSEQLNPNSAPTRLNLARLYRELADGTKEKPLKVQYLQQSQISFAEYIKLAFRGAAPAPNIAQEVAAVESDLRRLTEAPANESR
jgi:hypothetical protein